MGVFNIIWGSIPVVVLLSMYFNCRYMIKGDKNILIDYMRKFGVIAPLVFIFIQIIQVIFLG